MLVADPKVQAVVIASPQETHRAIAEAAFALGKPVFCEKPLGASYEDSLAMVAAAKASGCVNMVGFNYIRTPASRFARDLVARGDMAGLMRLCKLDREDIVDMIRELKSYDPKPGLRYGGETGTPVVPDVFVTRGSRTCVSNAAVGRPWLRPARRRSC